MDDYIFVNENETIETVYDEIFDLYNQGYTFFDEIPDDKRIILLAKLCKIDLTWLSNEHDFENNYEAIDSDIKNKALAHTISHKFGSMGDNNPIKEMDENIKELILAAEVYFSNKIDDLFDSLRNVPDLLNEIFYRE